MVATLAGAITMLASMGRWAMFFGGFGGRDPADDRGGGGLAGLFMLIVAPIAAMLIQLAVSRSREYQASHATGAHFTGNPYALASACCRRSMPTPADCLYAGQRFDGASVYYSAAAGHEFWKLVLDPSADGEADLERPEPGRAAEFAQ